MELLKILTWNCNGAFRKKFQYLEEFDADILIVQECENPEVSNDSEYKNWSKNYYWIGENKNKGLGIFAKNHFTIELFRWENSGLKYFLPIRINNEFTILGTW